MPASRVNRNATDRRAGWRWLTIVSLALVLVLGLIGAAGAAGGRSHKRGGTGGSRTAKKHRPKVLRVGKYKHMRGQYKTIQEALAVAQPGDWILIGPGDYKQSSQTPIGGYGDDRAPADIVVTTPNLHIRGMDRNTTVIDGTKPGSPQCSSKESDQNFGTPEGDNGKGVKLYSGNNGIVVYKTPGVWLQNFTACNFLGSNSGGDGIWFDGGASTGEQHIGSWWGEYVSATSTYWAGPEPQPSAKYGVYASNTYGPGVYDHAYASNMADAGIYIGACPDCHTTVNHSRFEYNALGYSGSNSGGHLLIENTEFDKNQEGVATTSQNNDDQPAPQEGLCPKGAQNPSPPAAAQRKDICWVMIHSRIIENNDAASPRSSAAPGLLGTGMTDAGGRNDLVVENTFSGNNAWGMLILPYPGVEEKPPPQILSKFPEDECRGGTKAEVEGKHECIFEPWANEVAKNTFAKNGGYGHPSNGDIGEVAAAEAKQKTNCWHGNTGEVAGEPSSEPKLIQTTHGKCEEADKGGESLASPLAAEATCDSQLLAECPGAPGVSYPREETKMMPLRQEPTMPDPCIEVPRNLWCKTP
jgi:hypothetical protein